MNLLVPNKIDDSLKKSA